MKKIIIIFLLLFISKVFLFSEVDALEIVKEIEERQRSSGDYKALCYVKNIERNKEPKVFQVVVFRRDDDNKFLLLFLKPREMKGKGYLKVAKNLWMYDPNTGKWVRRTDRDRIGGTSSRSVDFGESILSEDYNVRYDGENMLGKIKVYRIHLTVKEGVADVLYPIIDLWIDQEMKNTLKREEYSLSGKLMRTIYYLRWTKKYNEMKKDYVLYPQEVRIFDELKKGNSTINLTKTIDFKPLEKNIFTKAWIESMSR